MDTRKAIAALLTDQPADIDWDLFADPIVSPVRSYFEAYAKLPTYEFMKDRMHLPEPDAPWQVYLDELLDDKFVRDAMPVLTEFNNQYRTETAKQSILKLRENLEKLREPSRGQQFTLIYRDLSRHERARATRSSRIMTGIKPLDDHRKGIAAKGEYVIISARLNVGKSWVAQTIANNIARDGHKVLLYSGEMNADEVGFRIDTMITHASNFGLSRGIVQLSEDQLGEISGIQGDIAVLTQKELNRMARPSDLRRIAKEFGAEIIVIDQLSNMQADGGRGLSRHEERSLLSTQLKTLIETLNLSVIAVSQLNREGANQDPTMANIAESDKFGQDATLCLGLVKEERNLKMWAMKDRAASIPEEKWQFTWDVDSGILQPIAAGIDAVAAILARQRSREVLHEAQERVELLE